MFLSKWQNTLMRSIVGNTINNNKVSIGRPISTTKVIFASYYEALGLAPTATQYDIKAAYYKLSMVYHPDKNKGSDQAAQKFREITAAYEVLGNQRLRRLYDKGIIHTAGPQYSPPEHEVVQEEDDPQTKFYKARMARQEVPHSTGRAPIYNFDEWSRAHYGNSFNRKQAAKKRYEKRETDNIVIKHTIQKEVLMFSSLVILIIFYTIMHYDRNYDENRVQNKKKVRNS